MSLESFVIVDGGFRKNFSVGLEFDEGTGFFGITDNLKVSDNVTSFKSLMVNVSVL